jgi:hypothetical protein
LPPDYSVQSPYHDRLGSISSIKAFAFSSVPGLGAHSSTEAGLPFAHKSTFLFQPFRLKTQLPKALVRDHLNVILSSPLGNHRDKEANSGIP